VLTLGIRGQTYAAQPGPNQVKAAQIYAELRKNVVDAVYNVCEGGLVSKGGFMLKMSDVERRSTRGRV
jgi:hypothetical protein